MLFDFILRTFSLFISLYEDWAIFSFIICLIYIDYFLFIVEPRRLLILIFPIRQKVIGSTVRYV